MQKIIGSIAMVWCCLLWHQAAAQWVPVAPIFSTYMLNDVHFKDNNGVLVGQRGLIALSNDSGYTWSIAPHASGYDLFVIGYAGGNTYYACGEKGEVIRSGNLGLSWTRVPVPSTENMNSICFITTQTGWVAGEGGGLFKTTNGGASWQKNDSLKAGTTAIAYVKFFNANDGVVVFRNGTAKKTTNGGLAWTSYNTGLSNVYVRTAAFTSLTRGCFLWGNQYYSVTNMRQTFNGSSFADITSYTCSTYETLTRVIMMNDTTMYLLNNFNMSGYSTNSATTWSSEYFYGPPSIGVPLNAFFYPNRVGIVGTVEGIVIRRGANGVWTNLREYTSFPLTQNYWTLSDMLYKDTLNAIALYRDLNRTLFLRSQNGGNFWSITDTVGPNTLNYSRASANKIFLLTTNGLIYKSTDTGTTWSNTNTCPCKTTNQKVVAYRFFDDTGFLFCSDKSLFYTTNGGLNWTLRSSRSTFNEVYPVNQGKLFALGNTSIKNGSYLYRSVNAGLSWDSVSLDARFNKADFAVGLYAMNDSVVFAGAQYTDSLAPFYKTIHRVFRSSDNGSTWKEMGLGGPRKVGGTLTYPEAPHHYVSAGSTIWMWGYNGSLPVHYSPDAGVNWYAEYPLVYMEFPFMHALNSQTAYTTSRNLTISKSRNAGLLPMPAAPAITSNQLTFSQLAHTSMRVHWQHKTCDKYLLVVSHKPISILPLHAIEYSVGADLGDTATVMYVGNDTTIQLTGLTPDAIYYFALFHYNGSDQLAHYNTNQLTLASQRTYKAPEVTSINRSAFCGGDSIFVNFASSIPFTDTVIYRLYLSNEVGVMQVPNGLLTEIKSTSYSGTLRAKIPANLAYQSYNYRVAVAVVFPSTYYVGPASQQLSIAWYPSVGIGLTDSIKCTQSKGFQFAHTGSLVSTSTRLWYFPNGTTAIQTPVTYFDSLPGTKTVKLVVNNRGCMDSATRNIRIYAPVKPRINISSPIYLCTGNTITFSDTTVATQALYNWYKNGTSLSLASPSVSINQAGDYVCQTHDEDSTCFMYSDTIKVVSVKRPAINYQVLKGPFICDGDSASLGASSDTTVFYHWQLNAQTVSYDTSSLVFPKVPGVWRVQAVYPSDSSCVSAWAGNTTITVYPSPPPVGIMTSADTLYSSVNSTYYYEWYRNDTALNHFLWYLVPNSTGNYRVELKTVKGCSSISDPLFFTYSPHTGIKNAQTPTLKIYPNPFNKSITVEGKKMVRLRLMDVQGRVLEELNPKPDRQVWSLEYLPYGIYMIEVQLEDGSLLCQRLIKISK